MSKDRQGMAGFDQSPGLNGERRDMTIAFDGVPVGPFGASTDPDAKRLGLTLCAASALLTVALTAIALL